MNTARSGGSRSSQSRWRPTSIRFSVRVPGGTRSGRCKLRHRLRKRVAGAKGDAAALAQLAEQRRQRDRRPDAAAAVAPALQPVARRQHQRVGLRHPACQGEDLRFRHAAGLGRPRGRPFARPCHERVGTQHMRGDERRVERAGAFQLRRQRPGQQRVGARQQCDMQVGLCGNLGAQRVDHDQFSPGAHRSPDATHQMQIGNGRVVAPHHVQPRVLCMLWRTAGHGRRKSPPRPRYARRRTTTGDTPGWRRACERTAATCCRRTAIRAGRHSSAAPPPAVPSDRSQRRSVRGSRQARRPRKCARSFPRPSVRCGAADAAAATARARRPPCPAPPCCRSRRR